MRAVESFKKKIRSNKPCVGTGITLTDPVSSELCADAGFDFVWIDAEHAPLSIESISNHILALRNTSTASFVRVRWNDRNLIKSVLDQAPSGIIIPMVNSAPEAAEAVTACKYPPVGRRGYGPRRATRHGVISTEEYLKTANDEILVFIQIEHVEAVRNLDEILQVEGLDGICLGPMDLSGSIGKLGQITHPEVVGLIDTVTEKVRKTDLFLGVSTAFDPESLGTWLDKGIQWLNLSNDWQNLYLYSKMIIEAVRQRE